MPIVHAGPDEYLLIGRGGRLENRGSAVNVFLLPGSVHVVVPGSKHEATFEFTQETSDGIPLRFKGIVVYRVVDPLAAARQFDFVRPDALHRIGTLLTDVCLGELRHAVSHMTMAECIEQRKTTLTEVVLVALNAALHPDDAALAWGVTVDVAQVAQVFIVDADLRTQLEAEVRDAIRLRSDRSRIGTVEATSLAEMASRERVEEERLAADREKLRRDEQLEVARLERERRLSAERSATERHDLALRLETFQAAMASEQEKVRAEAPTRRLRSRTEREVLATELEARRLANEVKALEVEHEMLLPRAEQELQLEILPLEQAPDIVAAASGVLRDTNLTLYGEDGALIGRLAPLFDLVAAAVERSVGAAAGSSDRRERGTGAGFGVAGPAPRGPEGQSGPGGPGTSA